MHVERTLSSGVGIALVLTAACSCDPPSAPKPVVVRGEDRASVLEAGAVAEAGTNVDEAELVRLGRRVRDAATAVAKRCTLYQPSIVSNFGFWWMQDICRMLDGGLGDLTDAVAAFRPAAERAGGGAAAFAIEAAMFSEFVALAMRTTEGVGTLAHYQDVARFWNNWRKDEITPLDPVEPSSGWNNSGIVRVNGVVKWERCGNAPCARVRER